jgi:hypothetical protein
MPPPEMLCHVAVVRTNVLEEHWFLQDPHGVTSQKMAFFNTADVLQGRGVQ